MIREKEQDFGQETMLQKTPLGNNGYQTPQNKPPIQPHFNSPKRCKFYVDQVKALTSPLVNSPGILTLEDCFVYLPIFL